MEGRDEPAGQQLGRISVSVQNIRVKYKTETGNSEVLKESNLLTKVGFRIFGKRPAYTVNALRGVSFVTRQGEAVGLVGLNGSGKSTLLRIIAGVETPAGGTVKASSRPVLLGVSAALIPDLSGMKNIRLGCYAMGLSAKEAEEAIPKVAELADLGESIYLPMKTYSSGMASRLRFAIATATQPEILLIDEALNTGDAAFRDRSEVAMTEMRKNAGTVFLVSHAAQTIEEMCTRAIWLHKGKIVEDGKAYDVARNYRQWAWHLAKGKQDAADELMASTLERYVPQNIVELTEALSEGTVRHEF